MAEAPLVIEFEVGVPPVSLVRYTWHVFFAPSEATEVEVTFAPQGTGTLVRLEQRGFDRLGETGPPRRAKTEQVWGTIAVTFARSITSGGE